MTNTSPNLHKQSDFEFAALAESRNYRAGILRDFQKHLLGNVLEVGAGVGQFTSEFLTLDSIQHLTSVEPDPAFCTVLRQKFPQLNLIQGTVTDLPQGTDWNAIFSSNVLEHIDADQEELTSYANLLRPACGHLCLFVPARPEIYAPIDSDFGHFRRYTRPGLRKKLEKAGFRIVQLRYYNFVGYFAWWASFCLLRKRTFDPRAVRIFDRLIFPVVHSFETRICAPPFGQSLLAIAAAV